MTYRLAHPLDSSTHSAVRQFAPPAPVAPSVQAPKARPRPLTERQVEVLRYICEYFEVTGVVPAVREIMRAFGFSSTNGVADHLRSIARKGYLTPSRGQDGTRGLSRSYRVTHLPDGTPVRARLVPTEAP